MTAEQELERISFDILDAIRAKNADSMARHLAGDFVHRDEKGTRTTRAEFLAAIASAPMSIERLGFESISIDVFGPSALVSGVQSGRVVLADGQALESRSAFTDLFVLTAEGWRLQAATSADL